MTRWRAVYVCEGSGARIPVEVEHDDERAAMALAAREAGRSIFPARSLGGLVAAQMPERTLVRESFGPA